MRIRTYQTGGVVAPFSVYLANVQLAAPAASTAAAASTAETKKDELLSDEMKKLIMNDGLPSDVESFMKIVENFEYDIANGLSAADSATAYLQLLPYLNRIKYNKAEMESVKSKLYENGGIGEAAISANGEVVVKTAEGGINVIPISKFNPEEHQAVSNNELIQLRAYDKSLSFNNNLTSILKNGEGTANITKQLQDVISQMKLQKEKKDGFIPAELAEVLKYIDGATGVLKLTQTTESSRVHMKSAMNYLLKMLPQNSRNLLMLKAKQTGSDITQIMSELIIPSTQENITEEYDAKDVSGGSFGSGSGTYSGRDITWLDSYVGNSMGTEDGGQMKMYQINPGDNYSIFAPAIKLNQIRSTDNEPIPRHATINKILTDGFGGIGDAENVYFGDDPVSPDMLENIISTGTNMAKAYLPIDLQYYRETGKIKPDLLISEEIKNAEEECRKQRITSEEQKYQIYRQFGVEEYLTADPTMNKELFAPFATIPSWAQGEGIVQNKKSPLLKEVDDDDEVKRLLNEGKFGRNDKGKPRQDYLKGWMTSLWNDTNIYQGLVFIHTPDDVQQAAASGSFLTAPKAYGDFNEVATRQAEARSLNRARNLKTSTSNLD